MKQKILLTLFTISLTFSILLAFTPTEIICGDQTSSCTIVQNSEYQETLGINNSILGIMAFTILILITASNIKNPTSQKQKALLALVSLSAAGATYFIYIQAFVIKALCPYCMIIDISIILALIVLTIKRKNHGN
jgi:uncharacterized membrane protein